MPTFVPGSSLSFPLLLVSQMVALNVSPTWAGSLPVAVSLTAVIMAEAMNSVVVPALPGQASVAGCVTTGDPNVTVAPLFDHVSDPPPSSPVETPESDLYDFLVALVSWAQFEIVVLPDTEPDNLLQVPFPFA